MIEREEDEAHRAVTCLGHTEDYYSDKVLQSLSSFYDMRFCQKKKKKKGLEAPSLQTVTLL